MRWSPLFSSAAILAAAALASAADSESSDVFNLTPANFISVVNPEPIILVEFFAPWCGHCKALAPHYEEAATALKEKNIKLAKVDCVDQADLCQQYGVQGYPTLKVFRHGEPSEYTGPRKADGIISYMIKQSLPAVAEVTAANHEEIQKADKIVLIAYLSTSTDAPGPEFIAMAEKHRDDYLFGVSTDEDVIEAAGVTPPAVVMYRSFDEPRIDFTGTVASVTVEGLETFVKDNAVPLMDQVGPDNYQVYVQSALPLAYLFVDVNDEKHQDQIAAVRPVAAKFKGQVNFVWIDGNQFADHAKALNLAEAKWPSFIVQDLSKQLKYPLDQSVDTTPESAEDHVAQFVAGKLEPTLKSEPIPASQDENVITLVGKNFDDYVFDESKDVFVEFYAPWCGHCKRLKPTWDSLAERYENFKDRLLIAKMDATENDLPPSVPFRVAGFPTLKFRQAGSREFIDYDGDRSLESLIEFVEEKAKNDLKTPMKSASKAASATPSSTTTPEPEVFEHDEL